MEDERDIAHLRQLAAKCWRLASDMPDLATASSLRQMAKQYQVLADRKDRALEPELPRLIIS